MSPPLILRAADGRRMPWKNGGGETVEILAHPLGAALDGFDWRVSMAHVATDGPFSLFPGIDRTLTILDGEGLELSVGDAAPVRLTAGSAPFAFPADAPCAGRLLDGPVRDLNVMTRRGRFSHAVAILDLDAAANVGAEAGSTVLVVCRAGTIAVGDHSLGPHDVLRLDGPDRVAMVRKDGSAAALVVTIRPV